MKLIFFKLLILFFMTAAYSNEIEKIQDKLKQYVTHLSHNIGERSVFVPKQLRQTEEWIEDSFKSFGFEVKKQTFEVHGQNCSNLIVEIPGISQPDEIVIIGAHYDTAFGTTGANDNGSGVASLLSLSEFFYGKQPQRTIRFVAFVNEEPPFFQTEHMGSMVYARSCRDKNENVIAMISLETLGYYVSGKKTQSYPSFLLKLIYGSRGNFIAFVGNSDSKKLVKKSAQVFKKKIDFLVNGISLPNWVEGVSWSDHGSFWEVGYPAFMITDTAFFRYPYYHTSQDTHDKLNYESFSQVVYGLRYVMMNLVNDKKG